MLLIELQKLFLKINSTTLLYLLLLKQWMLLLHFSPFSAGIQSCSSVKGDTKTSTATDRDGQNLPTALHAAPLRQGHFPEGNRSCWHNTKFTVRPFQSGNERSDCRWATVLLVANCLLIPIEQNTKIQPHERVLHTEYGEEELSTPVLKGSSKSR